MSRRPSGVEGDFGGGAGGGQGCGEVACAGVGFVAGELDAWGERHVGVIAEGLLIGDFDHLVLGHAGGEDWAELAMEEEREGSAGDVASA